VSVDDPLESPQSLALRYIVLSKDSAALPLLMPLKFRLPREKGYPRVVRRNRGSPSFDGNMFSPWRTGIGGWLEVLDLCVDLKGLGMESALFGESVLMPV
jgi:hypothetical protein